MLASSGCTGERRTVAKMKAALHPDWTSSLTSPISIARTHSVANLPAQKSSSLRFCAGVNHHNRLVSRRCGLALTLKGMLDSEIIDQLGLKESELRNPSISTSYRIPDILKPNQKVLEAQTRVCTGPTQTKPLSEEQAFQALETILKSVQN